MAAPAAATNISSVEQIAAAAAAVIDRSQYIIFSSISVTAMERSSISMTGMGRAAAAGVVFFFKWFVRITMYFRSACLVLTTCLVIFVLYQEVAGRRRQKAALARRKRQRRLRRRQRRSKMMSSIRDAPYEEVAAAGVDRDEEACVICRTEYEGGETCSLLPRCTHMFHKACIVAWLSHHTTRPICRATVYTV